MAVRPRRYHTPAKRPPCCNEEIGQLRHSKGGNSVKVKHHRETFFDETSERVTDQGRGGYFLVMLGRGARGPRRTLGIKQIPVSSSAARHPRGAAGRRPWP